MKTRLLIGAAALVAATAFTTPAQNLSNLVKYGYLEVPLVEGFNLLANQLDFDGTGTNNTPANVLSSYLPVGSVVYGWAAGGGGYNIAAYARNRATHAAGWTVISGAMPTLNVGQGFWLSIPAGSLAGTSSNLAFAGEILEGALVNTNLAAGNPGGGFGLVGSRTLLGGGLTTELDYQPSVGDTTYQWNTTPGVGYTVHLYASNVTTHAVAWKQTAGPPGPAEPTIGVGEGFWLNSGPASFWSNYFTVE